MGLVRRAVHLFAAVATAAMLSPSPAAAQTSPEKFLGFRPGADRQLADYQQIEAYLRALAKESPRVRVVEIGETTLKKKMVMAVVTTAKNMERLERYKQISHALRDARGLSPQAAADLASEGKVILALGCNIHSTEIASSQMALELAYRLASGQAPFDVDRILSDVIVLIIPSVNPDGEQMVTEWYRKYVGTAYEGGRMPWLYHHYAGHDNNRDFYMFNLPETRAVGGVLYRDWLPQVFIDEHQMGSNGARQFIAPYNDPTLPDVHPLVWRGIEVMGANMRYDLEKAGKTGIVSGEGYTGWWTGGEDEVSWPHNIVAFLTEAASAKVATPITLSRNELGAKFTEPRMNLPHPWPGGTWRLQDIVENELIFNFSAINTVYQRKTDFLLNFYRMNKDGIDAPGGEGAFIVPANQHDPLTALKMIEIMREGGLEVQQAEEPFVASGKSFPAGSFIVPLAQPYRPYAITLLDRQKYPDLRQYEGGPPIAPYDNAAWTLPMLMGVATERVDQAITARVKPVTEVVYPAIGPASRSAYLVLDCAVTAAYAAAAAILNQGGTVARATEAITVAGRTLAPGAFVVRNDAQQAASIEAALRKWHVAALPLDNISSIKTGVLSRPRIGLYQSYQSSMDEGWTRYALEDLGIPYVTLHNKELREAKASGLQATIDVLILPSEDPDVIVTGQRAGSRRGGQGGAMPSEYEGGIGRDGVDALKAFVKAGGTVVTVNEACGLAFRDLDAPATDALRGIDRTKFFLPNSIVRIAIDPNTPIGFGMPSSTAAMFANGVVMDTFEPGRGDMERQVVATYPSDNILLSGWLIGGERMAGKAAVVDVKDGKGRVVLFGLRPFYRAQSHGTYKLLLNALLYPGGQPLRSGSTDAGR